MASTWSILPTWFLFRPMWAFSSLCWLARRLTTAVAYVDLGRWNTVVALAIAVVKMLLVVLFFMHVKYNPGLTRIVIVGAFFWLGIMICFSMADELTRGWEYTPLPWNPGLILPYLFHFLF